MGSTLRIAVYVLLRKHSNVVTSASVRYVKFNWNGDNDTVSGIVILDTTAIPEMRYAISLLFRIHQSQTVHCVSKKRPTLSFAVTLTNTDRFSKFFHWYIVWKIFNNAIIKYATTP